MITNKYTKDQLTEYSKETIIQMFLTQQETMSSQIADLQKSMDAMMESIRISNQKRFGSSTEKIDLPEQLSMCFNEAEVTIENKYVVEPVIEQVVKEHTREKTKGKCEEDLAGFESHIEIHQLKESELTRLFPNGYKTLPDEVYKKLEFHPATFEVIEHHIRVYSDKTEDRIVRADRPAEVLKNSIVTPSLLAAVINAKYINSVPLYRLEQEFLRNDVTLSRQVMANWVIRSAERYFSMIYDRMHQNLYQSSILHADETPVEVIKDGRPGKTKSYMWVYRTGKLGGGPPSILYEYQKTRHSDHPRDFLKDFRGVVVCDGYQVYHKLGEERPDQLKIAGCWAHARRKFANVCKSLGKKLQLGHLLKQQSVRLL